MLFFNISTSLVLILGDTLIHIKLKDGAVPSRFAWNEYGEINALVDTNFEFSDSEFVAPMDVGASETGQSSSSQEVDPVVECESEIGAYEHLMSLSVQEAIASPRFREMLVTCLNEFLRCDKGVQCNDQSFQTDKSSNINNYCDQEIQTDAIDCMRNVNCVEVQTVQVVKFNRKVQTESPFFSVLNFEFDKKGLHFYTGLETFEKFRFVFETLGPASFNLTYYKNLKPPEKITEIDQFFLTLIYLRSHKTWYELGVMFKITEKQAHNIAVTWIKFMNLQWRRVDIWPPKELVNFHIPKDFYNKYPGTRVIIDGTEIPMSKPNLPLAQQSTFSKYKHKNTAKLLVGASPGGLVSYVSPTFGGSTSDRQIVERVDLIQKMDPSDHIMADKGFDVDDLVAPYKVHVNVPTYFRKTNRIAPNVIKRDRKIASKRVHIERIIGLAKTYSILNGPLKKSEIYLSEEITFVCFMLCNFRKKIVSDDA